MDEDEDDNDNRSDASLNSQDNEDEEYDEPDYVRQLSQLETRFPKVIKYLLYVVQGYETMSISLKGLVDASDDEQVSKEIVEWVDASSLARSERETSDVTTIQGILVSLFNLEMYKSFRVLLGKVYMNNDLNRPDQDPLIYIFDAVLTSNKNQKKQVLDWIVKESLEHDTDLTRGDNDLANTLAAYYLGDKQAYLITVNKDSFDPRDYVSFLVDDESDAFPQQTMVAEYLIHLLACNNFSSFNVSVLSIPNKERILGRLLHDVYKTREEWFKGLVWNMFDIDGQTLDFQAQERARKKAEDQGKIAAIERTAAALRRQLDACDNATESGCIRILSKIKQIEDEISAIKKE